MEIEGIEKINKRVADAIAKYRLKEAIETLGEGIDELQDWSLRTRFNQMQTSYNYLSEYLRKGTPDPTRESMYYNLIGECYLLNDLIAIARYCEHSTSVYCQNHRKYKNLGDLERSYIALRENTEKRELAATIKNKNIEDEEEHEKILDSLFLMIWSSAGWQKSDAVLVSKIINDIELSVQDRAIILSAITMSLLKCFEPIKAITLINATESNEILLAVRAVVGIIIALQDNYHKLQYYPELTDAIKCMGDNERTQRIIEKVQIQLLLCRETVKIDRKMREDIIPAMLSNPNINKEKLGIDIIGESDSDEDKNPEWEKWLEDSNIQKKLEELDELQKEGADLYMGTFSQLKKFPFFNEIKNWFRPFSIDIPAIAKALPKEAFGKRSLFNKIFSSSRFCDSDKFSFCLTFQSLPKEQMDFFTQNIIEEAEEEDMDKKPHLSADEEAQVLSNMYIQDLYRFFKLSYFRREFHDPFADSLNILESQHLAPLVSNPEALLNTFKHLANKGYYKEAFEAGTIYENKISAKKTEGDALFYQEMGYCLQKEEKYEQAIDYYTKADIIKADCPWTLQHIAQCYRLLEKYDKAASFYLMSEEITPDSLPLLRQTGECLVTLKRYDEAFARFFKVEYLSPDNIHILRAIAWCSFLAEKSEQARNYYQKIFNLQKGTFVDYMNAAHVEWVTHNNDKAIELYAKARELCGDDNKFYLTFNKDLFTLNEKGVQFYELQLLRDIIFS